MTGIVKRFNLDRGYGFIKPLIGDPENVPLVFFHLSAIVGGRTRVSGIPSGAEVRFDLVRGNRGPQAANVEVVTLKASSIRRADEKAG